MSKLLWGTVTLSLALAATGWHLNRDTVQPEQAPALADPKPPSSKDTPPSSSDSPITDQQRRLLEDPAVTQWEERLEFQAQLQAFLDQSDTLSPSEREHQAGALQRQLEARAAAGELTAGELLVTQMALMEHQPDRDASRAQLIEQQQQRHEEGMVDWEEDTRSQREAYEEKQRRILKEVDQRTDFPNETARNRYLRERLQEARVEVYNNHRD